MNENVRFHTIRSSEAVELASVVAGSHADTGFVFLHGILQSALSWKYQLAAKTLQPWRMVAFDLRGHGFSSKPMQSEQYGGDEWATDLRSVLDTAGLRRTILVGWSFGGRVILDYLERHGQDPRIAGLVFIDANTKNAPGHISEECITLLGKTISPDMAENIDARRQFVDMCFCTAPSQTDWVEMLAYNNMTTPEVLKGMLGRSLEHDDLMGSIRLPTCVIHGKQDKISLPKSGQHTAATIPNSTLHLIENAGHMPQLEAPEKVNALLADFATGVFGAD